MRYWTRIGLVSSILFLSFILLLIFLAESRTDLSNDEAALILQSSDSSPKPIRESAPIGILIVVTVISIVLVVSGFIIIAMILDPSTSLVEDETQEDEPMVNYPFHV